MAISELQPRFQSPLAPLMEQFVRTKQACGYRFGEGNDCSRRWRSGDMGSQASGFAKQPSIFIAQCRAALVASVAETLPPYSSLFAAVPISHGGADSNIVGSAGVRVRLSGCRGRTSSHHCFASSRAVSALGAVVRAWTVAQPGAQADLTPASQHSAVSCLNHCRTGAHRVAAVPLAIR
jgi:hypothetical protein